MTTTKVPFKAWVVCLTAGLFFFFIFIQLNAFNSLAPYLLQSFQINAAQMGQLSSYLCIGNMLLLFPAGMLLDRFSPHKIILIALGVGVLATYFFAITHGFWIAAICRLFIGFSAAFTLLGCIKLASRWFPPERMAFITGLMVTMAMLGGMVAQTPFTLLIDALGWRIASQIDAFLGVLIWLLILLLVRDYPAESQEKIADQHKQLSSIGFWRAFGRVIIYPQNWLGGLYTSLINLPVFLLGAIWGIMYLAQAHGFSRSQASYIVSGLFIGLMFGSPFFGWLSDTMKRRRRPMIIGAVFCLLIILLIMYIPKLSFNLYIMTFFLLGFVSSSQVIGYPLVAESNSPALTGTAVGLASILIMAGGLAQPIFGWLMDLHWQHIMINGQPVYALNDYHLAMLIIPIGFAVALLLTFLVRETYCRFDSRGE